MERTYPPHSVARLAVVAVAVALILLLITPGARAATSPRLVKDINASGSSNPSFLTQVGSTLFFAANDGVHGTELWKSDGTTSGTKMVKNIGPKAKSSSPQNLINVNGTLFFTANDGIHGRELWKSNGTAAGTTLVKDIATGPAQPFGLNSIAIQVAIAVGSRLFFFEDVCCVGTSQLYVSDGTSAGTQAVSDSDIILAEELNVGGASGLFYFVAIESNYEGEIWSRIWSSDGTLDGTHPIPTYLTPDEISILPAAGRYLYFAVTNQLGLPPAPEHFMWRTDGTAAGTKQLTTLNELNAIPTEAVLMSNRLYWNGVSLWKTDGTAAGTVPISNGAASWLTNSAGRLFFTRGSHLWRSNGTAAGTTDQGTLGARWPRMLVAVRDMICFAKFDYVAGTWTLWESNGTKAGTYLVRSFAISFDWSDGVPLGVAVGSKLLFAADDGSHGVELWSYTP